VKKNINQIIFSALALSSLTCSMYAMNKSKSSDDTLDQSLFHALTSKEAVSIPNRVKSITILLSKGANLTAAMANKFDALSINPDLLNPLLFSTAHFDNPDITRALLDAGAAINARGERGTALCEAVCSTAINTVKFLMSRNANTILGDAQNQTPLLIARTKLATLRSLAPSAFVDPANYFSMVTRAQEIVRLLEEAQEYKEDSAE